MTQISLLVPFKIDPNSPNRLKSWNWLREYWESELPDAEIVMGTSHSRVFSKTEAVNDAASRATGRIFVILDADAYMPGSIIKNCADRIDEALKRGQHLWFIPYQRLYRLNEAVTELVLESNPRNPLHFPTPPGSEDVASMDTAMHGRKFGALCMIVPKEGFEEVGGMDSRFSGWGGEDISFVRALDTLYGDHRMSNNDILHLWHPNIGTNAFNRMWSGQNNPRINENRAFRYHLATGDRVKMRALVNEVFDSSKDSKPIRNISEFGSN